MPSAPPICCDVLMSPDARPASFGLDAREGRDRDRHERERHADRDDQEAREAGRPSTSRPTETCVKYRSPTVSSAIPITSTGLTPTRVTAPRRRSPR